MRRGPGRIVLHVGAPKTGSTYLQRRLRVDPGGLRRQGVHVPVLPSVAAMAGNAKLLSAVLSGEPSPSFRRAFPDMDVRTIDPARIVTELLAEWRPEREDVVLSDENLRPSHAARLRELLPAQAQVIVILFVRRQDRWIESYHNQLIKTADVHTPLDAFLETVLDPPSDRLCRPDWWEHHTAWRDAFGDCRTLLFDEVSADIFGSFFRAAGAELPVDAPEIPRQQESLDLHEYAYLSAEPASTPFPEFVRRRAASAAASQRLGAPAKRSLLTHPQRERLAACFAASNRHLLSAIGRSTTDPALFLSDDGPPSTSLAEVQASEPYARHRDLADAIYAGEFQAARTASAAL